MIATCNLPDTTYAKYNNLYALIPNTATSNLYSKLDFCWPLLGVVAALDTQIPFQQISFTIAGRMKVGLKGPWDKCSTTIMEVKQPRAIASPMEYMWPMTTVGSNNLCFWLKTLTSDNNCMYKRHASVHEYTCRLVCVQVNLYIDYLVMIINFYKQQFYHVFFSSIWIQVSNFLTET